jgi:hypothetical protein
MIRDKDLTPLPVGAEEIRAEDIVVIVPPHAQASEELCDADIIVDEPEPFRPPSVSVHATQEVLVDDVLAVEDLPRDERPSTMPWSIDAGPADGGVDEFAFPEPPHPSMMSGSHRAIRRITSFSATQIFRRRSMNVKVVAASVGVALSLVILAGVARLAPASSSTGGPVGISTHAPKKLDKTVRGRLLAYGTASALDGIVTVSVDSLPPTPRYWRRHR